MFEHILQWLSENQFYVNIAFVFISFIALLVLLRPLLLWYFGYYKTHRELSLLKQEVTQQSNQIASLQAQLNHTSVAKDPTEASVTIGSEQVPQLTHQIETPKTEKNKKKAREKHEPWLDLS
ncbi:hypothetical protein [Gayadomonas joobiniege]|uniref:hypothetical protein n=1 Tax=Gayadomonas joobiniege TaxID=1234606 RepID=UPI0003821D0D|nr:hypothetical protein [Gayadomonas joobiniege]